MNDLRTAAQQALEALDYEADRSNDDAYRKERDALRAALAEPDLSRCPQCGGHADNGHDRCIPPNPYYCTKCMAEPVPIIESEITADKEQFPRKPLTDEEIRDLWSWAMTAEAERTATTQQHAFARAIERAHGINDE